MRANPVNWFEIYVQDMNRARAFYEKVLDTQLEPIQAPEGEDLQLQMWGFPMAPDQSGASGALVHTEGVPSGGNSIMVYFSCEDCSVEGGRVEAAGGHLVREKMSIGEYGFIVLAHDTEGNMFGLHSLQ